MYAIANRPESDLIWECIQHVITHAATNNCPHHTTIPSRSRALATRFLYFSDIFFFCSSSVCTAQ